MSHRAAARSAILLLPLQLACVLACLSTVLQVLSMFDYYYGLESIPDDMVVNELLGVPTYLLHGA